jgi:polyphosphate kinase
VLALVEIKARFDEQANIAWARRLEQHMDAMWCTDCLAQDALQALHRWCAMSRIGLRRYAHIGTGNYNPKTLGCMKTSGC